MNTGQHVVDVARNRLIDLADEAQRQMHIFDRRPARARYAALQ